MSDLELTRELHANPDPLFWAEKFCAEFSEEISGRVDEGLMLTWFANAMGASHDETVGRYADRTRALEEALLGAMLRLHTWVSRSDPAFEDLCLALLGQDPPKDGNYGNAWRNLQASR